MNSSKPHVVLVPVKPPAQGKSRLDPMPVERRVALATAFALDTITAASQAAHVEQVLVVTDDHQFAMAVRETGCAVIPDGVTGDLNGSLHQAAHEAARRWPGHPIAALCADVPALQAADLDAALNGAPETGHAFVRDAAGTGTSMYVANTLADFDPRFGVDSAAKHLAAGAIEILGDLPTLRRDVDDPQDLTAALTLGVGSHTAAALLG